MKLKNSQVVLLNGILTSLSLDITESSARRRFLREIKDFVEDVKETQTEIQAKYSEKDETGAPKSINNTIQFNKEGKKKANSEWNKLNEEEVTIDVDKGDEKDIQTVSAIIRKHLSEFEKEAKGSFTANSFDYHEDLSGILGALASK